MGCLLCFSSGFQGLFFPCLQQPQNIHKIHYEREPAAQIPFFSECWTTLFRCLWNKMCFYRMEGLRKPWETELGKMYSKGTEMTLQGMIFLRFYIAVQISTVRGWSLFYLVASLVLFFLIGTYICSFLYRWQGSLMGEVEGFQSICPINSLEIIQSFFCPIIWPAKCWHLRKAWNWLQGVLNLFKPRAPKWIFQAKYPSFIKRDVQQFRSVYVAT